MYLGVLGGGTWDTVGVWQDGPWPLPRRYAHPSLRTWAYGNFIRYKGLGRYDEGSWDRGTSPGNLGGPHVTTMVL